MSILFTHIKSLAGIGDYTNPLRGKQLAQFQQLTDAFLYIENDKIKAFGSMHEIPDELKQFDGEQINASGKFILPAFCDSHTHLVFAGSREQEFVDKINGLSYAEIAAKGGGILNSAKMMEAISEDELFELAQHRLQEVAKMGTGSIEIKSGYGLSVSSELKMLRVIKRLKETSSLTIRASFLGAHAFPLQYRDNHQAYIQLIINEMLPVIAKEGLADYIDVFCENGFFSVDEMEQVCKAGISFGLKPKLHINQLNSIGGLQKAIEMNAVSVDHLEVMTDQDIRDLSSSSTIGTLLPTAAFCLRMPFQPARQLIDAGTAIALASDFNPGSSPSANMQFVVALSCIQMKMLPEEAFNAATINGAFAMECAHQTGSIAIGKKADIILTKPIPSLAYIPYSFAHNQIDRVMIAGQFIS